MKKHAWVHFGCNDPDNGDFAGKVWMAAYNECEIETDFGNPVKFTAGDDFIQIHRRKFRIVGRSYWVGNWCWDAFKLPRSEAKRLIGTMRKNRWRCTHGPAALYDWWNCEGRSPHQPLHQPIAEHND